MIRPFDASDLKEMEKAIRSSDLGMSPNNDGKLIRLQVPPMSGDQRTKMASRIKKSAEDAKVACRNVRRDGNKHYDAAEKNKEMTEDDARQRQRRSPKSFEDLRGQSRGHGGEEDEGDYGAIKPLIEFGNAFPPANLQILVVGLVSRPPQQKGTVGRP